MNLSGHSALNLLINRMLLSAFTGWVLFSLLRAFGAKTKAHFVPQGPQTPLWNGLGRGETLHSVFIHQPDVTCRYDILVTAFTDTYSPINSHWREHRHTNGHILSQWHYSDLGNLSNNNRLLLEQLISHLASVGSQEFSTEIVIGDFRQADKREKTSFILLSILLLKIWWTSDEN